MNFEIIPYEGKEDFIFVGYSHKDTNQIMPILHDMQQKGYRIWYDEGIDPGTEWPETIAKHLKESSCFMAFISNNTLDSHNCKREIYYAIDNKKEMIVIFLEELEMSEGMRMQLSGLQATYKFKYEEEEKFYQKLYSTSVLKSCLKKQGYVTELSVHGWYGILPYAYGPKPGFEIVCMSCGYETDFIPGIDERPPTHCPKCGAQ